MSKTQIVTGGIADDAVSEEHLDATAITGSTELASAPADTDEILISDAGTLKRIDFSLLKTVNTPAWAVTMNGNQSGLSQNAHTLVEMDTELLDTDNAYTNTSSNYKFTVPSGKAGTYVIGALLYCNTQTVSQFRVQIYKNGNRIGRMNVNDASNPDYPSAMINLVDVASAGDYYQCYCYHNQSGGITVYGGDGTGAIHTHGFFGYRLTA